MSRFFFFTNIDSLGNQADADAFGPVIGSPETKFRVTSMHRPLAGKTATAYAVCHGRLLAQAVGPGLVNLILQPDEPPPFAFPRIKYFIYRGVLKSTVVANGIVAPADTSDLTKYLWEWQQARNKKSGVQHDAPAEALGLAFTGNGAIDDCFFQEGGTHQLATVQPGWSLGEFNPTRFGFEIMVETVGFDPQLPLARITENVIGVPQLPSPATQAQEFEHWHDKEAILNYVDPCAFFGSFSWAVSQGLEAYPLNVRRTGGAISPESRVGIYTNVLKGAHLTSATEGVFFNRDRTYLDIRNEFNHSLNYFKNYGVSYADCDLQSAFSAEAVLSVRNYYENGWPLMIIENADFPAGNQSDLNVIRLGLPDGLGDNPFPTLYVSAGYLADQYPREPKLKAKLVDLNVSSGFTNEVALVVPNHDDHGATRATSSYIKLKYFKRFDPLAVKPPVSSGTVIRAGSFFDNLFAPLDLRIPFKAPGRILSMIYDAEVFVDMSRAGGFDYVANVGIYDDGTTYTFVLNQKIIRRRNEARSGVAFLSGGTSTSRDDVWTTIGAELGGKVPLKSTLQFSGTPASVPYVTLVDQDDGAPVTYDEPFFGAYLLTCRKSRLLGIDTSQFTPKSPIYLGANNLARYADEMGREYWNFNLSLTGYVLKGDSLEVKEIVSDISMYVFGDLYRGEGIQVGTEETSAAASSLPLVPPVPPIKHVFVLMLENRSFDHMLGFSGIGGIDAKTGGKTAIIGASKANTNLHKGEPVSAKTPADFQIDKEEAAQGPPHEFADVLRQLCGEAKAATYDPAIGVYPTPDNQGFISSYAAGNLEADGEDKSSDPENIMNCYSPDQLPVLNQLARDFAVCDQWFSSLPGPTWPNRFFVHAATSGGLAVSPGSFDVIASTSGFLPLALGLPPPPGFGFEHGHIYDRLDQRGIAWRVYEDGNPQVFSLAGMNVDRLFFGHYREMGDFVTDVMDENFSPLYTFIEPDHGRILTSSASRFMKGNSQHPRDDVRPGEMLIKLVYETIRNSPHWQNSVLVITYDEHGGFYDHVVPPTTDAPPGDKPRHQSKKNKFDFKRLGVRVPAVIVSPLIPKGTIDHMVYDHSSVLATLERMFRLEPLTERDRHANDFRHLFSLTIPRDADAKRTLGQPPAKFETAKGPDRFRDDDRLGIPAPILRPAPRPVKGPRYRFIETYPEHDLEKTMRDNPTLRVPTELSGNKSPDLIAWLHVAFRRRLAVLAIDDWYERRKVLEEYCAIRTADEAEAFIVSSEAAVDAYRAKLTTWPDGVV